MFREAHRIMNEVSKEYLDVVVNNQREILDYAKGFNRNIENLQNRNRRLEQLHINTGSFCMEPSKEMK